MPIKILDPKVVAQIAAGEVVERPASVVKELLENALDAQANQISVEVRGGGVGLIRVIDNGAGIPSDEVELAFERHATSKISGIENLSHINTLGFRGEALPSIAAVAQVEMVTCATGESSGTYVRLENGGVVEKGRRARSQGTTATVRNLFRNVPARLKFLKSDATENSHIANVITQYALSFPEVKFTLIVDDKETLRTGGSGKLLDAIIAVYGLEVAQNMLEVRGDTDWQVGEGVPAVVTGMVGAPSISRSSRGSMSFFVNRRWVNSRLLSWAVEEAYHGLLMTNKHPVAVINISIPPERVDVNIHPAKAEVKFQDEKGVVAAVHKSVRKSLLSLMPVPGIEEVSAPYAGPRPQEGSWQLFAEERRVAVQPSTVPQTPMVALPLLRVLGQIASEYIVAEGPDGLYIIDQHAAHERILYERIRQQKALQGVEVQGLLEPATFEVSPRQEEVLKSHYQEMAEFGFNVEPFGDRTYLVRGLPSILNGRDWKAVLGESMEAVSGEGDGAWQEKLILSMACHGAVRSGQTLADDEMRELVTQLGRTELPHTCPHGRPTVIHLTLEQLAREFRRV